MQSQRNATGGKHHYTDKRNEKPFGDKPYHSRRSRCPLAGCKGPFRRTLLLFSSRPVLSLCLGLSDLSKHVDDLEMSRSECLRSSSRGHSYRNGGNGECGTKMWNRVRR